MLFGARPLPGGPDQPWLVPALPGVQPDAVHGVLCKGAALVARAARSVWREQRLWSHGYKEVVWRFWADALPTAARMHRADAACVCGAVQPGRAHHFRDCPVAAAVLAELQAAVPGLRASSVWLMLTPPGLHAGLWRIVCVAAVNAMDVGRREACKRQAQRSEEDARRRRRLAPGQQLITDLLAPAARAAGDGGGSRSPPDATAARVARWRRELVQQVALRAVARLWELLAEFEAAGAVSRELLASAPADHPILRSAGARLVVVRPGA